MRKYPQGIVRVKDGDFWVADGDFAYTLTRVTPQGKRRYYRIGHMPLEMIVDPKGNFWITVTDPANEIVRVTPSLRVTVFTLSDVAAQGITLGADGNIWFVENTHVGKLTPEGALTEYPTGQTEGGSGIAWADGLLWFRVTTALASLDPATGAVTTYGAPMGRSGGPIVPAPDGSIWYNIGNSDYGATLIRFDPKTGTSVSYSGPPNFFPEGTPAGMIFASHQSLWYTTQRIGGGKTRRVVGGGLVRFDLQTETFTAFATPKGYYWDWDLVAGPNGTIWATAGASVTELKPD